MQGGLNLRNSVSLSRSIYQQIMSFLAVGTLLGLSIHFNIVNKILLHVIMELFVTVVALSIAIIAYNTYHILKNARFMLLGIAYCYVGGFFLLHILTIEQIDIFKYICTLDISVQFNLVAKYVEAVSLLLAFSLSLQRFKPKIVTLYYLAISSLMIALIVVFRVTPACMIVPYGPTLIKQLNEIVIIAIYVCTLYFLVSGKCKLHPDIRGFAMIAVILKIISQIFILSFSDVNGVISMLAHFVRLASFYFVYKTMVESSLKTPVELLFYELDLANHELKCKTLELEETNMQLTREIGECKRMDVALRESEERYRLLIKFLPDAIFVHDNHAILFANKLGAELVGVNDTEGVIGKPVTEWMKFEYNTVGCAQQSFSSACNQILPIREYRTVGKDGEILDIEVKYNRMFFDGSSAVLVVAHNITERKKADELRQKFEEKTKQLDAAVEMDKLRTEFFANLSHELRTPLNIIFSTLQLFDMYLNENLFGEGNIKVGKHINTMRQNCYRLLRLVNNLIDTTKIDAGFYELHPGNHNIIAIVEDITLSVAEYIRNKNIELQFDTNCEEKIIACDPDKIERIVLNLLSNSVKFTDPGGSIFVSTYVGGDKVLISIKDTGIGIPQNKLDIIFERFRQVDRLLTRKHEGSGIGLSLVKSLVEMHGGHIWVESQPGVGSNFSIELPARVLETEIDEQGKIYGSQEEHVERINVEFSDIYL